MSSIRSLVVLTAVLTLLTATGTAVTEGLGVDFGQWETFEDRIDSCQATGDSCITDDNLGNVETALMQGNIWTGNNGFCGTGGIRKTVTLPDKENLGVGLSLQLARLDYWGGSVGLKVRPTGGESEWLIQFTSEGGEPRTIDRTDERVISNASFYYADISDYAGQEVEFQLVTEDLSDRYCNNYDHEQELKVNGLWIVSGLRDNQFDTSSTYTGLFGWNLESWDMYSFNINECNSGAQACETDDSLATNEISGGQLILDTGDSGTCGVHGRNQWVYVPKADTVQLAVKASAELDDWAGEAGIVFNQNDVHMFDQTTSGESIEYPMDTRTVDITQYAGQVVNMKVVQRDDSSEYCSEVDHGIRMVVDSIEIRTEGDEGEAANEPPTAGFSLLRTGARTVDVDATRTTDPDNPLSDIEVRWDWTDDGSYDTDWRGSKTATHTYEAGPNEGDIRLQVRDGDGGSDSTTRTVELGDDDDDGGEDPPDTPDQSETVSLNLHSGWNMISIPAFTVGTHLNAANITGDCTFVATSNDKLGYHYPSEDGNYLQTDTVESSRGYWVETESSCTANFSTNALAEGDLDMSLASGWNMVSPKTETSFSEMQGDCSLADSTIYHWNGDTYQQLTTSDTLDPKKAYWVDTQNSCTLNADAGGPPPSP